MTAKGKGNKFERDCCALLQRWWGKKFTRVPLSGGWKETQVAGDVFPVNADKTIDDTFPFCVECKFQENWDLIQLFKGTGLIINSWWKQCETQCPSNKLPLLMFTKTGAPVFMMTWRMLFHSEDLVMHPHITVGSTTKVSVITMWNTFITTTTCHPDQSSHQHQLPQQ